MDILIRKTSTASYNSSDVATKFFAENAGEWVSVETNCLFTDQYNTADVRIYDADVEAVRDDARIGMGKCNYCGALVKEGETCIQYASEGIALISKALGKEDTQKTACDKYGIKWFTAKNTYFINHPKGLQNAPKIAWADQYNNSDYLFGTYRLSECFGMFRLENARQSFKFRFDVATQTYSMENGTTRNRLKISAVSFKENELKAMLTKLMK